MKNINLAGLLGLTVLAMLFSECNRYNYIPKAKISAAYKYEPLVNRPNPEIRKNYPANEENQFVILSEDNDQVLTRKSEEPKQDHPEPAGKAHPGETHVINKVISTQITNDSAYFANQKLVMGKKAAIYGILIIPGLFLYVLPGIIFFILFISATVKYQRAKDYLQEYAVENREKGDESNQNNTGKKQNDKKGKSKKDNSYDAINNLFFFLLIANFIVWLLANWDDL